MNLTGVIYRQLIPAATIICCSVEHMSVHVRNTMTPHRGRVITAIHKMCSAVTIATHHRDEAKTAFPLWKIIHYTNV